MKNPRNVYVLSNGTPEEVQVFSGRVLKVTDRTSYASVSFYVDENAKDENGAPKTDLISVMCFGNNGGVGVDHRKIALNAEQIRQSLTGDEILYATIIAVKQKTPDGKINYKARSTSFCVSEKGKYLIHKNPVRAYFKPEQADKFRMMSGYVTRVFENEKYNVVSFRANTEDKDAGFVAARCFPPFDKTKARMNNYENATAIQTAIADGQSVHCVVACLETPYDGKTFFNAMTVSYCVRVR